MGKTYLKNIELSPVDWKQDRVVFVTFIQHYTRDFGQYNRK